VEISIVIPTRNRSKKLKKLLHSILEQTILPKEVIVVDDSENLRTKELIQRLEKLFLEKNIQIKHIMPLENKKKSISRARNIGAKKAKGDIIVFIDDDVIIDKNYLKEILKVFEKNPDALGVQGTIINMEYSPFWNSVKKVFYYWHAERNKCRMLPSGKTTYAYAPDIVIPCEWLFGLNVAYKREVFEEFSFNEKLTSYSLGEDKEFSYGIHKKYPHSLFQTPHAKVYHSYSHSKNTKKQLIYIITAYPISFFYNNIKQTTKNKIIFIWSEIGRIILRIFWALPNLTIIKYIITSYIDTLKHLHDVKNENFSFIFNYGCQK